MSSITWEFPSERAAFMLSSLLTSHQPPLKMANIIALSSYETRLFNESANLDVFYQTERRLSFAPTDKFLELFYYPDAMLILSTRLVDRMQELGMIREQQIANYVTAHIKEYQTSMLGMYMAANYPGDHRIVRRYRRSIKYARSHFRLGRIAKLERMMLMHCIELTVFGQSGME